MYDNLAQWAAVHDAQHPQPAGWPEYAPASASRLLELDDFGAWRTPHIPGYGPGSVISERTYRLRAAAREEFAHLSRERAGRGWSRWAHGSIAFGHDPLGSAEEVQTLTAFRSFADWQRLSHPAGTPRYRPMWCARGTSAPRCSPTAAAGCSPSNRRREADARVTNDERRRDRRLPDELLVALEALAVELAALAGAESRTR